ncbi:hypothetical protein B1H10_06040 [candidate division KSB1 bacterium 4484_188]|nr:MAG: hypothetical protein B1H10_06040 [candidate division KSB1 bacterium 4484_188]
MMMCTLSRQCAAFANVWRLWAKHRNKKAGVLIFSTNPGKLALRTNRKSENEKAPGNSCLKIEVFRK